MRMQQAARALPYGIYVVQSNCRPPKLNLSCRARARASQLSAILRRLPNRRARVGRQQDRSSRRRISDQVVVVRRKNSAWRRVRTRRPAGPYVDRDDIGANARTMASNKDASPKDPPRCASLPSHTIHTASGRLGAAECLRRVALTREP